MMLTIDLFADGEAVRGEGSVSILLRTDFLKTLLTAQQPWNT